MLPITSSKHLTVQIITTSFFITYMLLSSFYPSTDCLPITSKPIESTVENLAWEAWLMVPVAQHQKSRKVTPKSIFIVPQKKNQSSAIQCPPGEHLFESRCIPTVNIDTEKLLIQQLTNFVVSPGEVYDYDYEEELINDPVGAEKLEGGNDMIISSNSDTADAPLKFDIFRDNFPIGSSGSGDSSGNRDVEDDNIMFSGERRRRPPIPVEGDLDTQSSSYGLNHDVDDGADDHSTLFLSGIDAILLPAVSGIREKDQNLNFSIYQDVVNTSTVSTGIEILSPASEKVTDIEQILKNDSLFLDKDHKLDEKDMTTTEKSETTTDQFEGETTTMKLEDDEDVESKTEFVRSVTAVEEESTDSTEDTSTMTTEDDEEKTTTPTIEPSEESTTSTDSDEITTINAGNDETTIKNEEITTMISSSTKFDRKEAAIESFAELVPSPDSSGDRFFYKHHSETKSEPEVMSVSEELNVINELVTKNRKLLATTTSSVEDTSKSSTRIIPKVDTSATTSSTSSSSSTTTTSASSSSSSSTESSTDDGSSSSPASSTTETPAMAKTDPFWWLPTGWRVDQSEAERPFLLRFWSALSGPKVKPKSN